MAAELGDESSSQKFSRFQGIMGNKLAILQENSAPEQTAFPQRTGCGISIKRDLWATSAFLGIAAATNEALNQNWKSSLFALGLAAFSGYRTVLENDDLERRSNIVTVSDIVLGLVQNVAETAADLVENLNDQAGDFLYSVTGRLEEMTKGFSDPQQEWLPGTIEPLSTPNSSIDDCLDLGVLKPPVTYQVKLPTDVNGSFFRMLT